MKTYLLPAVTNGSSLVIEFNIVQKKRDMRLRFCKQNEQYIVDEKELGKVMADMQLRMVRDSRLVFENAKQAREFARIMGL